MACRTYNVSIKTRQADARLNMLSASSYIFSSARGRQDAVFDVVPALPPGLQSAVAFGLAIGVATELHHSQPDLPRLAFNFRDGVPHPLLDVSGAFEKMTGTSLDVGPVQDDVIEGPQGTVFVTSGGKDTLYAIQREAQRGSLSGAAAVYLTGGAELSWRTEIPIVQRVCEYYGLQLHVFDLKHMYHGKKITFEFTARAAWRELVTIPIARQFGDRIVTGINDDAVFRGLKNLTNIVVFLSQLGVSVSALQRALNATIVTVPGEFEVYRVIRHHQLFNALGSCLSPDVCVEEALCPKCSGFAIYDAILDGLPLTRDQVAFILSPNYIGDAFICQAVQSGGVKCA